MIHIIRKVKIPGDYSLKNIRQVAELVFLTREITCDATIIFTNNPEIQTLNKKYRNIDQPTDVLSFPSEEIDPDTGNPYLGDIVISIEKALSQAQNENISILDELTMLIVHGCLHLTGLDHETVQQKEVMKSFQESILRKLDVKSFRWPEMDEV